MNKIDKIDKINTFVINLDDYRENFERQKPYLENIGLQPYRWSGINALKNEHINHSKHINSLAKYFTPKSCIGCSMSHILLAKWLNDNYTIEEYKDNDYNREKEYFLIMEDDAFPIEKYNTKMTFEKELWKTIREIELLDPSWDIIQLHRDGPISSIETYQTHYFCGSTAAYLISKKGIEKMSREKVTHHIDLITQNFLHYNKYNSKNNLFYTDEKSSLNRGKSNILEILSISLKKYLLENYTTIDLRGEKDWIDILSFNVLQIPLLNKNITINNIFDMIIMLFIAKSIKKYCIL